MSNICDVVNISYPVKGRALARIPKGAEPFGGVRGSASLLPFRAKPQLREAERVPPLSPVQATRRMPRSDRSEATRKRSLPSHQPSAPPCEPFSLLPHPSAVSTGKTVGLLRSIARDTTLRWCHACFAPAEWSGLRPRIGGALSLSFARFLASDQRFAAGPRLRATEGGIGRFALFFESAAPFLSPTCLGFHQRSRGFSSLLSNSAKRCRIFASTSAG